MSGLPCIMIAKAAVRTNVNLVLEAQGRGPGSLSRKMCAIDPNATWETPATHYMMQDMSATDTLVASWQAACNGDLPDIGTNVWGQNGIISSIDAQTACGNGNMQVYSAAGLVSGEDATNWRDGTFAGIGLQFVPDMPI
jgi:hypothetical protein